MSRSACGWVMIVSDGEGGGRTEEGGGGADDVVEVLETRQRHPRILPHTMRESTRESD